MLEFNKIKYLHSRIIVLCKWFTESTEGLSKLFTFFVCEINNLPVNRNFSEYKNWVYLIWNHKHNVFLLWKIVV